MTSSAEVSQQVAPVRVAEAFKPTVLVAFARRPDGAHLFRVQHEHLMQLMNRVVACTERPVAPGEAHDAHAALRTLAALMPLHQAIEERMLGQALAGEPRIRAMTEQFEREMAPYVAELAAFKRRYSAASSILRAPRGEFAAGASALFVRLQERFRREERDLFPAYDRSTFVASATAVA